MRKVFSKAQRFSGVAMLGILAYACCAAAGVAPAPIHHSIAVSIFPEEMSLRATDSIYVSSDHLTDGRIGFLINRSLAVENVTSPATITGWRLEEQVNPADFTADPDSDAIELAGRARGILIEMGKIPAAGWFPIVVTYAGVIHDSLQAPSKQYAQGFETTNGLIGDQGVYLANQSLWYPFTFDLMFTFRLTADVPADWMAVSQGALAREHAEMISGKSRHFDVWVEDTATEECYLVAGKYYRHQDAYGDVKVMTYTYQPSDSLAQVYIEATKRYLALYDGLIGPYPYPKFALVENFWQTGYGMPSFTLLGSRVIRLPFIVNTSYGHEILHNWWGNSVYVDYKTGNWCEGLTTYGADYLYKERAGAGQAREYRHTTLVAFHNYVTERKDFPLTDFLERSDAATQSVGYGKSLMVYHMLRRHLGDQLFWDCLREFYARFKFKVASWSDIENVFSEKSGEDLGWFFDQWLKRPGAPAVSLAGADYLALDGGHRLTFTLRQTEPAYSLDVPVVVETTRGREDFVVRLRGTDSTYTLELRGEPRTLAVDPDFDTFRHLYVEEIPVTLGSLFAQDSVPALIGGLESETMKAAFRDLATALDVGGSIVEEPGPAAKGRPIDSHAWLMGRGLALDKLLSSLTPDLEITGQTVGIADSTYSLAGKTLICAVANPADRNLAIGIVLSENAEAIKALGPRLIHYGSYSYLVFDGSNLIAKGVWKEKKSPLRMDLAAR
jgi:aminopeptidase N